MNGPVGSGKLSLVRGLAALINSRARKFLFDWEVELEAQQKLLNDLSDRINAGVESQEVWIHRKIHLVRGNERVRLISALRTLQEATMCSVICYATSETTSDENDDQKELEQLFSVRITLGEGGFAHGAFDSILASALSSLRRKYGRPVTSIEPEAIRFLEDVAKRSRMPAMLSVLERGFIVETGTSLHVSTLMDGSVNSYELDA